MNHDLHDGVSDQASASRQRFADASVLLRASRWRGAMYLGGYAVECLLKTKLMHIYTCQHLRELDMVLQRRAILPAHGTVFTHHLEELFKLTGSYHRFRLNQNMTSLFSVVNRWAPGWRYARRLPTRDEAVLFMEAVEKVMHWIDNNL